jgi:hypothetical protein
MEDEYIPITQIINNYIYQFQNLNNKSYIIPVGIIDFDANLEHDSHQFNNIVPDTIISNFKYKNINCSLCSCLYTYYKLKQLDKVNEYPIFKLYMDNNIIISFNLLSNTDIFDNISSSDNKIILSSSYNLNIYKVNDKDMNIINTIDTIIISDYTDDAIIEQMIKMVPLYI